MLVPTSRSRRAASLVETAITLSIMFLFTLGVIVVGMGVHAYQQVGALAREGARYAAVHGAQYASDSGSSMATATSIKTAVNSMASGLDTSQITVSASWDNSSEVAIYNDSSANATINYVHVTVTYTWSPPLYLSPVTLSSTSVLPMQY
jgi:Flp pilus assembly protein TadG